MRSDEADLFPWLSRAHPLRTLSGVPETFDSPHPDAVERGTPPTRDEGTEAVSAEAPTARGSATGTSGRAPLHVRLLDAEELDQLQVLRGAVEPSAPIYAAILSVLVAAKERYQVEVRTEQLAAELSQAGPDASHLAQQ